MAIEVQSLTELDAATVASRRELLAQQVAEAEPRVDLKRGVIHDLILELSAALATATQTNIDRLRRSNSIAEIELDPELSDPALVDKILSNYRLTRREGTVATGQITIVTNRLAPVTIEQNAKFEASGQLFSVSSAVIARTSAASVQSANDKVLTPLGNGNYAFTVTVSADTAGSSGRVKKDTLFVPVVSITNFVKAYAVSDFGSGINSETNTELAAKLQTGLSCKTLSNRVNMSALLLERFPSVVASAVIGFGDPEMLRDQHSIIPVSFGGRVDWYVKTAELPENIGLTVTATLMSKTVADGSGVWQFSIDRDTAPGFYDVRSIRLTTQAEVAGSFAVLNQIRDYDTSVTAGLLSPDIINATEAAFSPFQTAVVQFTDNVTSTDALSVGATADYSVTLRAMPLLSEIQTSMSGRSTRHYAGDVLIKAPVPCFLSISFTLEGRSGATLPAAADIKADLASYVNKLGFPGRLYGSKLLDRIGAFLPSGIAVNNLDMFAKILYPDGTTKALRSPTLIEIPNEPDKMVSPRTVCFLLDQDNIAISARSVNTPE